MREIEALGAGGEEGAPREPRPSGGSAVPLVQGALCLAFLLALLCLKALDLPAWDLFAQWYEREASQTIQLPRWEAAATPSPVPSPTPAASPAPGTAPALHRL